MTIVKTNVISPEYLKFQEDISTLYKKWLKTLSGQEVVKKQVTNTKMYPLLPQQEIHTTVKDYRTFIAELSKVVEDHKPELSKYLGKIQSLLNDELLNKWFTEAIAVNGYYFSDFATEHQLPEWLPFFVAENAARPYIQKAAQELGESIPKEDHKGACPVCGEPARLGVINKSGKKELTCPRCHFSWEEKKISCAHCGTEEQGQVVILKIEEDEGAEIYACKSCNGYTKVIDARKLLKVAPPELLDLKSIHLDYVAQDKGYGMVEDESSH